jgi:hypothetical protein
VGSVCFLDFWYTTDTSLDPPPPYKCLSDFEFDCRYELDPVCMPDPYLSGCWFPNSYWWLLIVSGLASVWMHYCCLLNFLASWVLGYVGDG